jgi:hypothetical protein
MANSDKNVLITPNRNLSGQPEINFTGFGNSSITLKIPDSTTGTLNFESSGTNLFSVDSNLASGSLLSISDEFSNPLFGTNYDKTISFNETVDIYSSGLKLDNSSQQFAPKSEPGTLVYDKNDKTIKISSRTSWDDCNYQSIVKSGLVVNLDASKIGSYPGTGTTWYDLSGNGNHATLSNGPAFNLEFGGSIVLDGSDDIISISDNSTLDIGYDKTICCWIYLGSDTGGAAIAGKQSSSVNGMALGYGWNSNGFQNIAWNSSNTPAISKNLGRDILKWVYVIGVQSAGFRYVFAIDTLGVRSAVTTGSSAISWNNSLYFGIGITGDGASRTPANTRIGAVQVYNRALNIAEIERNFNAQRKRFGL